MKTKVRLTLALGALALLVFVLAAVSFATIWSLRGEGRGLLQANYTSIEYMQGMVAAIDGQGPAAAASLHALLAKQQANITEMGEDQATAELAIAVDAWTRTDGDSLSTALLRQRIARIVDLNKEAIVHRVAAAESKGENALVWIGLTGTFCALIALSMLFSIPEHIAEPIRKLTEGIDRVAGGDYRERVELARNDEFGHMADRFNAMASELQRWESSNLARIMDEKARVEAVLNSLQDAAFGVDHAGCVLFVNRKGVELIGMEATELIGASVHDLVHRNDLMRLVITGNQNKPFKAIVDGKEQFFAASHTPINNGNEVIGIVHLMHNITLFQERDQNKTMFLATISHELKTPLASTDLGLSLLERQPMKPEMQGILDDLRKDHKRLVRIVSELLDMAQVESGRMRLEVREVLLKDLVQAAVEAVSSSARKEDISLEVSYPDGELLVAADGEKATWALINLLSNALRHAPARSTVTVRAGVDGDRKTITVADSGPGIPAEQQSHLFERFTPHSTSGTGLGLSIAREMMRAMGGDILLRSSDSNGSIFSMEFSSSP
ncbi:MAG: HAMP domain-containing protein [Flavobacteriales bacterium]|nr:HAMP domain-containing protein [Flavobacteriales bacterium]